MVNTLHVDGLARITGYDKDHICCILSHRTASPHALYDVLGLDGLRGKPMNALIFLFIFLCLFFLSFFLYFRRPNLITGLSGWRTPD